MDRSRIEISATIDVFPRTLRSSYIVHRPTSCQWPIYGEHRAQSIVGKWPFTKRVHLLPISSHLLPIFFPSSSHLKVTPVTPLVPGPVCWFLIPSWWWPRIPFLHAETAAWASHPLETLAKHVWTKMSQWLPQVVCGKRKDEESLIIMCMISSHQQEDITYMKNIHMYIYIYNIP